MARLRPLAASLAVLLLVLAACAPAASSATAPPPAGQMSAGADKAIVVFAAASLTDAFNELAEEFSRQSGGLQVVYNYGGSNQLRSQLEQGAVADVFASANEAEMARAQRAGLLSGDPRVFARNRLVVILPKSNPGKVEQLRDLAKPRLKLIIAAKTVPVGGYTLEMLGKLAADPAYGAGFDENVLQNVVSEETNVRQVVSKIQLGEGDAGVVYTSDVTPAVAPSLLSIDVPDQFNVLAAYPIATLESGQEPEWARRYVDFVLSDAGRAILRKHGFVLP